MMAADVQQKNVQRTSWITRSVSFAAAVLGFTYPFLIYSGWHRINPRLFLGGAIVLFGLRVGLSASRMNRRQWTELGWPWMLPGLFLLIAFLVGRRSLFLYWPAVISLTLLVVFGRTLLHPPTLVERFALLQKSELTPVEVVYCKKITQLWCLFFVANGALALILAQAGSLKSWTLYNGLISYLLVGGLMTSEYVYRHWRFRPKDAVLTKWMNRWSH
jgi:uncharacterized membrane protein